MKQVVVRYKVKPGREAENEALVRAVYDELDRRRPEGLRYATFAYDDGHSFLHLASYESDGERSPFEGVAAFERFKEGLPDRCEEPPVRTELRRVGAFRM
jgi:hypothetical protein